MKFSVLLPTRNRLKYLIYAIETVIKQDYSNWEIIVSDNDSEEKILEYISSLKDERIKYFRTEHFCPVTDNWNNALVHSTGDYIIMLGDDDGLLDGYFSKCISLIKEHKNPEVIYNSAFVYTYPGALAHLPNGNLVQYGYAPFLLQKQEPYILDQKDTRHLVDQILNFNVAVNFNMQHILVSREMVRELQKYGAFYQSPYPDYYATTALLLKAERILAVPYPMVVIGVCPKSFGSYYFNNKEKQGIEFLQTKNAMSKKLSKYVLPGTEMNISWLMALESVFNNFGKEYVLKVGYIKFRFLQILHTCKKFACYEGIGYKDMVRFVKNLFFWEYLPYACMLLIAVFIRLRPRDLKKRSWANYMAYRYSHPSYGVVRNVEKSYSNILEVFNDIKIENV